MENENKETSPTVRKSSKEGMDEKQLMAVLAYLPFLCVVLYVLKDKDEDIRFHARQGIVIFAGFIMGFVLGLIPIVGVGLMLISTIFMLIGMSKAYKGEKYKIPYVYKYSEKINF